MTGVIDPPRFAPLPPGRIDWGAISAKLARRPGAWAAVAIIESGNGAYSSRLLMARWNLEVTRRTNRDGTATVWARYVEPFRPFGPPIPPLEWKEAAS